MKKYTHEFAEYVYTFLLLIPPDHQTAFAYMKLYDRCRKIILTLEVQFNSAKF